MEVSDVTVLQANNLRCTCKLAHLLGHQDVASADELRVLADTPSVSTSFRHLLSVASSYLHACIAKLMPILERRLSIPKDTWDMQASPACALQLQPC